MSLTSADEFAERLRQRIGAMRESTERAILGGYANANLDYPRACARRAALLEIEEVITRLLRVAHGEPEIPEPERAENEDPHYR